MTSIILGSTPGWSGSPDIVYVFPEFVIPYANSSPDEKQQDYTHYTATETNM